MSTNILIPYNFHSTEKSLITKHFKTHTDWVKVIFNPIKTNIIAHLRTQQNNTCCYCKYPLGFDIKQVDIEHIIPKSEYEKFTFHPYNLALSCPACNTKKSSKTVLYNPVVSYPANGESFKIIHAHFDNYSSHIDIVNNCIFVAKSSKGSETITYCELYRLSTVEKRVKSFNIMSPNIVQQLIIELQNGNKQANNNLMSIIKEALK